MKIVIVGCGNVGTALVEQLSREGHNITVVDEKEELVQSIANTYDVMGIAGNGAVYSVQLEAGVGEADLLIAVTGKDELNLLCCLIARKAGGCHTIARVSNPVYYKEIAFIKEELGLSLVINPQHAVAMEMARLLKFPSALEIDTFTKGRVELVKYKIPDNSVLCDMQLKDVGSRFKSAVLICVAERGEEVYIPDGNFALKAGDNITIVGTSSKIAAFFKKLGVPTMRAKDAMLIGGGGTSYYLATILLDMGVKVKIVDKSRARCEELCELVPDAMIICGDGTERELLLEEGLAKAESVVSMMDFDEENIMLSLYAKSISKAKIITRVHRIAYDEIIENLNLGSIVYPKNITAENIIKFVRAMQNSMGSNIESLYKLNDNRVEALEFIIREDCPLVGIPLQELKLKKNILVCSINHKGSISTPGGQSVICVGDTVVIVTTRTGFHDIRDILE
ncbi:MAG: Trk system potassium transporter TrkA [Lachnospiraceae bacterium]|nr:Trk system potassium transporter TrkA [Lachnospiraceae bacterium]